MSTSITVPNTPILRWVGGVRETRITLPGATPSGAHAASLLLESGSYLLLESGDTLLMEV